MQPRDPERAVRQSVLDRLLEEDEGAGSAGTPWSRSVARTKAALLRDLEWLLNTRRTVEPAPAWCPEVQRSLYHYGLPDLSSMSAGSEAVKRRLLRDVEEAVQVFEPRLARVRVALAEGAEREVRFVVEGVLQMDPEPQRVSFDTVLETASGTFRVSGGADA
jgi:type VI secretion system protein ImpF